MTRASGYVILSVFRDYQGMTVPHAYSDPYMVGLVRHIPSLIVSLGPKPCLNLPQPRSFGVMALAADTPSIESCVRPRMEALSIDREA